MNILIICTWFPPDTAIAAKRPYMFAKYLRKYGHNVTVIRSGEINKTINSEFDWNSLDGVNVISYLDNANKCSPSISRRKKLSSWYLLKAVYIYHKLYEPIRVYKAWRRCKSHCSKINAVIDKLVGNDFDLVFSTYGELPNVYSGAYAKKVLKCKWILDFRDRIFQPSNQSWIWNVAFSHVEKKYIDMADAVTSVSEDLFFDCDIQKRHTLYNGYEIPLQDNKSDGMDSRGAFSICFTGQIYGFYKKSIKLLFSVVRELVLSGDIDIKNFRFIYAGPNSSLLFEIAKEYNLTDVIDDRGYLLPNEIIKLQQSSDIFLVLSINTNKMRGVISGKFYEGISVGKPILSIVSGNEPNSELYRINQRYSYGECIELCKGEEAKYDLRSFIQKMYIAKLENRNLSRSTIDDFSYAVISRKLENICKKLTC